MKILELLLIDLKLNPAVVNVLIDYVLRTQNNRLVKGFIETIAGEWKRANIETAKEAIEYAEKSHKRLKKIKQNSKTIKKEEPLPVWFNDSKRKETMNNEEKEELEKFLKEFV